MHSASDHLGVEADEPDCLPFIPFISDLLWEMKWRTAPDVKVEFNPGREGNRRGSESRD